MNRNTTSADKEIILRLLRDVERRIRNRRLAQELTLGVSAALVVPIGLKLWDLHTPLTSFTISATFSTCAILCFAYAAWRVLRRAELDYAAASLDLKAGLYDQMYTAYWFITHRLSSDWIDAQVNGAAETARNVELQRLYPRTIPRMSYVSLFMLLIFAGLNFVPLSLHTQWLKVQAAPHGAAPQLEDLLRMVNERDLDVDQIDKSLEQIAKDLQGSEQTKDAADALAQKQLERAAEEFRKLAKQIEAEAPQSGDSSGRLQESLDRAADDSKSGTESLSEDLKKAANGLKNQNQKAAKEGLEQAANDLENIERQMQQQELKHQTARQLRTHSMDTGESEEPSDEKSEEESNGTGVNPSGTPARQGNPSTLEVELERERLEGMPSSGSIPQDSRESSKPQTSKLDYRNVELANAAIQKDVMNQDSIPWEYRPLIKSYLQAIRPNEKD